MADDEDDDDTNLRLLEIMTAAMHFDDEVFLRFRLWLSTEGLSLC